MRKFAAVVAPALLAWPGAAFAEHTIAIERPIVLAVDEIGADVAAYGVFVNSGPATSIVDAECSCAERLELHLVRRDGPEPGMFLDWPFALPENSRTAIEPPGVPRHLMLIGLTRAIAPGEKVALRFKLDNGEWVEGEFVGVTDSREAWGG